MKDNQTIAQSLRAHKQILFKVKAFPFIVKDDKGNEIYYEAQMDFGLSVSMMLKVIQSIMKI